MEDNLVLVILRDIQARLGALEQKVDDGFASFDAKLEAKTEGLRTEMRAGFQAVMYMLAIHRHDEAGGSNHGPS